ncbi:OsmC family protein [Sedimentitalea sp.]|uniref:OsmC family protein n=1 Tax=Sedimentitalea sp. TaxID=2048915 RepID=UPI0032995CDD
MNVMSKTSDVDNGVNVDALLGAKDAVTQAPAAAQFTWRAACDWVNGAHSKSTVSGMFGLGEEQSRDKSFEIEADHPALFAAGDNASTPAEIGLAALAACLTASVAAIAQHRGIQLHSVTARAEGDMDIRGILGADAEVRNGFDEIRVRFEINADATSEEIAALVGQAQKRSAVFDMLSNPTDVRVSVA